MGDTDLTAEEEKEFIGGYDDKFFKPADSGDQAASGDQTAAEKAAADKVAAEKDASGDQTADENAAAEKAAADKVAAEKDASGDQTDDEKAAADQAEADRVAAEKAEADKAYKPDYAKLLKDTADEIKRDNREAISRITTKTEVKEPDPPELSKTAVEVTKALEGLSGDQIKQTLQKVRDTDPETADAIEGLFSKVTGTVGTLAKAVDTMRVTRDADQAKAKEDAKASDVAKVETTIAAKHPNFRTIVGTFDGKVPPSDEFTKWFNKQPAYLQETARNTDDPNVFTSVLDKYVDDTKPEQTEDEKAAAEKAAADKVAAEKDASGDQTDDEKAIDEARRAGASQPKTKPHTERKATNEKSLNEDEEWMKGYNDPKFDKKK